MTDNNALSDLSGEYLLFLVIFKLIWPQLTYCECIALIANEFGDARMFSEKDADKALRKLDYTMKVTSTIAYQAFTERNTNCRRLY